MLNFVKKHKVIVAIALIAYIWYFGFAVSAITGFFKYALIETEWFGIYFKFLIHNPYEIAIVMYVLLVTAAIFECIYEFYKLKSSAYSS